MMLGILSVGTFAAASRPEVKAGYDCTQSCDKRACKISDFQWDLLDGLHHHAGLRIAGNGSVFYDTSKNRPGEELYSCNPAESQNQSMLMQHARTQGVKNILSLHPPKTTNPSFNSSSEVFQLLANTTNRASAVATACSMAAAGGFDGLSVDFEGKWTNNVAFRDVFTAFVAELAAACTSQSPALSVCSALAHDLNYDVAEDANAQAKAATGGIVLMTYDYLFVTSSGKNSLSRSDTPMYVEEFMAPASPNNNVNSSIHRALELGVPASALLMGIAWYGKEVPTVGPELGAKMNLSTTPAAHGRLQRSYNYQAPLAEQRANTVGGGRRWVW
jgi:spore germination protein YaaH